MAEVWVARRRFYSSEVHAFALKIKSKPDFVNRNTANPVNNHDHDIL